MTVRISVHIPTPKDHNHYGNATCSGVFVSPDEVLTAGHCVEESRGHQWIKTSEGKSYAATIEKTAYSEDLALLKIEKILPHKYIALGKTPRITDKVYTVNSGGVGNDDYEATWNQGVICNFINPEWSSFTYIMHNVAILYGASGSGLFNKRGQLVGVNTNIEHGFYLAVSRDTIQEFLHPHETDSN